MTHRRQALVTAACAALVVAGCGSSGKKSVVTTPTTTVSSGQATSTTSSGAGASPTTAASAAGGTASVTFTGGVSGTLSQPTSVGCAAGPSNYVYISIIGPVGGTTYDLELEAYGYTSGSTTFTVGSTSPRAGGQFGVNGQKPDWSAMSGTLTLTSQKVGTVDMGFVGSAGGGGATPQPVHATGSWACDKFQ